jgi:hypothetical protein
MPITNHDPYFLHIMLASPLTIIFSPTNHLAARPVSIFIFLGAPKKNYVTINDHQKNHRRATSSYIYYYTYFYSPLKILASSLRRNNKKRTALFPI